MGAELDLMEVLTYAVCFAAVTVFAVVGLILFSKGWQSYEEKYVGEAERTMEAMFLTIPPQHLIYLSFLCFFVVLVLFIGLVGEPGPAVALAAAAAALPKVTLRILKKRRDKVFREQLVPALQCLASALKAGFSLPKSFEQLEKESKNPMRQEIRILLQELRLGTSVEKAIENLYERMKSEDMDLVVNAIHIAGKVGGNLPLIFKQLEDTIRERMRIEGKVRALTAQGKFQGLVIAALPIVVAFALNVIYPELLAPLFTFPYGYALIVAILGLDTLGYFIIKKIVSIEI